MDISLLNEVSEVVEVEVIELQEQAYNCCGHYKL